MKAFFAQIDWVRNTFFFVFYFFLVALIFIAIIKPQLEVFKATNTNYRKEIFALNQIQNQHNSQKQELLDYQKQNIEIIRAFETPITQQEIEEKLKIIFDTSGVVQDGEPIREGEYLKQRYVVSGKLKGIEKLKSTLDLVQSFNAIVRFNFPLHIEKENEMLVFSFRLDVYYSPKDSSILINN